MVTKYNLPLRINWIDDVLKHLAVAVSPNTDTDADDRSSQKHLEVDQGHLFILLSGFVELVESFEGLDFDNILDHCGNEGHGVEQWNQWAEDYRDEEEGSRTRYLVVHDVYGPDVHHMESQVHVVFLCDQFLVKFASPPLSELHVAPLGENGEDRVTNIETHSDDEAISDIWVPILSEVCVLAREDLVEYQVVSIFHKVSPNNDRNQNCIDQQTDHDDNGYEILLFCLLPETRDGENWARHFVEEQVEYENDQRHDDVVVGAQLLIDKVFIAYVAGLHFIILACLCQFFKVLVVLFGVFIQAVGTVGVSKQEVVPFGELHFAEAA